MKKSQQQRQMPFAAADGAIFFARTVLGLCLATITALPATAETLEQAYAVALHADAKHEAARKLTQSAERSLQAAQSLHMPTVSVESAYTALDREPAFRTTIGPLPTGIPIAPQLGPFHLQQPFAEKDSLAYRAAVSLPLYTGGRISNAVHAADASVAAARSDEGRSAQDLRLGVAEVYVNVLRAQRAMALAESNVVTLAAHAADVGALFDKGLVSRNDKLASEVALANARQDDVRARYALDVARAAYNRALGRPLDTAVTLDDLTPQQSSEPISAMTERALKSRPELATLREQQNALHYNAASVRGGRLPQVVASAGRYHIQNQYLANEGYWAATVGLKWDIFDGGLVRNQAAALDARANAVGDARRDAETQVALQVRQAWLSADEAYRRTAVAKQAVAQAEENLRVARDRYTSGVGTNTEVLDAETLRIKSETNHINAVYDNVLATLRLRRAVGDL